MRINAEQSYKLVVLISLLELFQNKNVELVVDIYQVYAFIHLPNWTFSLSGDL